MGSEMNCLSSMSPSARQLITAMLLSHRCNTGINAFHTAQQPQFAGSSSAQPQFVLHSEMASTQLRGTKSGLHGLHGHEPAARRCVMLQRHARRHQKPFHPAGAPAQQRQAHCQAASDQADAPQASTSAPGGRMTYRPNSYGEIVADAAKAAAAAIADGITRLEVEFPPVPVNVDAYKGSSDLFIDSNLQLALSAAKLLAQEGKKIHVVVPDLGEYSRSYKMFKPTLDLLEGVTLGHLKEAKEGDLLTSWQSLFTKPAPPSVDAAKAADVFLICNVSCIELPAVEEYVQQTVGARPVVLWNLELDSLRGDLGLPAFPPKELHYRFLSGFRPAFFIRTRDYSKTVNVAPFIVNYSGALFREYPGPWQVMLKQDSGEYACIAEDALRYNLGEVKEELMAAMGLNTEDAGSAMAFLRRGYKTSTWFEDDPPSGTVTSYEWRK